jgi:mono/diheme cytochrome c family protein
MLAAATTQRAIGWVFFGLAISGFVVYILINMRQGKKEVGAEVELAANRKPYLPDDQLETKKLERSLLFALGMLVLVAVGLPFYWLGEPARQSNANDGFNNRSTSRGATLYEANCQQCHGPDGTGGVRSVTLTDENGDYYATVTWKAPALTAVLSRFDESEVLKVLNYGRNGVMPAFGAPGGGAFTTQGLDDIIHYLRSIQIPEDEIRAQVDEGVRDGAREIVLAEDADLPEDEIDAAIDDLLEEISDPSSPQFGSVYGKLLFNNTASSGAFSCARCHTEGWSYDATETLDRDGEPILDEYLDGGGWMAPSLRDGVTTRKFVTAAEHQEFITIGSRDGFPYLSGVASMGSGQMPGFGPLTNEALAITWPAILTDEQIAAIVAYERSL